MNLKNLFSHELDLKDFFKPESVAVIGVSENPDKLGHVIFSNFLDSDFRGPVFPVNPKLYEVEGHKCYSSINKIKEKVDLAIIAIPSKFVLRAVKECNKKGIKDIIIISSGFREIGNSMLENTLASYLNKNKMRCCGVNCLGIYDSYSGVDSLFLPKSRLKRPPKGGISFISQSGALGSAVLDLAAEKGYGFAKFISYGNATNLDESDFLKHLGKDNETKVICLYIEGVRDGKKFMQTASKIKKPIIAIKGGLTDASSEATLSHTGSLAGSADVYFAAFKQAGIIKADSLHEIFDFARLLESATPPKKDRVLVITNGGGYGILSADAIVKNGLKLAELSDYSRKLLRKNLPPLVQVRNPLDLVGDADTARYRLALETAVSDKSIDIILLVLLPQTPLITADIVDDIVSFNSLKTTTIVPVLTGSDFTQSLKKQLEDQGIACFDFPKEAVKALKNLVDFYDK